MRYFCLALLLMLSTVALGAAPDSGGGSPTTLQGRVVDEVTGTPIPDAEVSLPDLGLKTRTDAEGQYQLPHPGAGQPQIMSIEKSGYTPFSLSVQAAGPATLSAHLEKAAQLLVLDKQLHHLGDGSYSALSVNAGNFRKAADGPGLRLSFNLAGMPLSEHPTLQIGSIVGLDTAMVHYLTGNPMEVSASPLLVRLNGTVIAQVGVNGDGQKIPLPVALLKPHGTNILEIEAGSHYPEPGRLDYDDMELMHLVLYY